MVTYSRVSRLAPIVLIAGWLVGCTSAPLPPERIFAQTTPMPAKTATPPPEPASTSTLVSHVDRPAGCETVPGKRQFSCTSAATGLKYWLFQPPSVNTDQNRLLPLLVYLHGFSHSGSDLTRLLNGGLPMEIEHKRDLPMMVVSPQCPGDSNWQTAKMVERLSEFVKEIVGQYSVDPRRVYLTGFSMGGDGVWALGIAHPEQFAALAPVGSWYAYTEKVCVLKDRPVWVFQGNMDEIVSPEYAKRMVTALENCGGQGKLTIFPSANHEGSSGMAYSTEEFYEWLLEQEQPGK